MAALSLPAVSQVAEGERGPVSDVFFFLNIKKKNVDHFKVFIKFVTILILFMFCLALRHGILALQPQGLNPHSLQRSEGEVRATGSSGKSLVSLL